MGRGDPQPGDSRGGVRLGVTTCISLMTNFTKCSVRREMGWKPVHLTGRSMQSWIWLISEHAGKPSGALVCGNAIRCQA
jgi:hypothetical protein